LEGTTRAVIGYFDSWPAAAERRGGRGIGIGSAIELGWQDLGTFFDQVAWRAEYAELLEQQGKLERPSSSTY